MRKTRIATTARSVMLTACFFVAIISALLWGGAKPDQQLAESASPPQAVQPPPTTIKRPEPVKVGKSTPPKLSDVQSTITRVYEGTLTVNPNNFLVGDFDGDGSQDLVAVVSPITAMLPRLNSELARWKL